MSKRARDFFAVVLLVWLATTLGIARDKNDACSKPPELVSTAKATKEEQRKARELRAQGSVVATISEQGDVTDAKVAQASSKEAATYLLSVTKAMKYKPRPGCGPFRTIVNFTLAGQ